LAQPSRARLTGSTDTNVATPQKRSRRRTASARPVHTGDRARSGSRRRGGRLPLSSGPWWYGRARVGLVTACPAILSLPQADAHRLDGHRKALEGLFVDYHRLLQLGEQALPILLEPAALGLGLFQATVAVLHALTQLLGVVVDGLATTAGLSGLFRHRRRGGRSRQRRHCGER
jgi:hypothetical protein